MTKEFTPIRPITILAFFFGFMLTYQTVIMWAWYSFPSVDTFLLRFSLSNADIVAFAAFTLAWMSYNYFYKGWLETRGLRKAATALTGGLPIPESNFNYEPKIKPLGDAPEMPR